MKGNLWHPESAGNSRGAGVQSAKACFGQFSPPFRMEVRDGERRHLDRSYLSSLGIDIRPLLKEDRWEPSRQLLFPSQPSNRSRRTADDGPSAVGDRSSQCSVEEMARGSSKSQTPSSPVATTMTMGCGLEPGVSLVLGSWSFCFVSFHRRQRRIWCGLKPTRYLP